MNEFHNKWCKKWLTKILKIAFRSKLTEDKYVKVARMFVCIVASVFETTDMTEEVRRYFVAKYLFLIGDCLYAHGQTIKHTQLISIGAHTSNYSQQIMYGFEKTYKDVTDSFGDLFLNAVESLADKDYNEDA